MKTEQIEQLINQALANRKVANTNYHYELKIGAYPIKITMGVN